MNLVQSKFDQNPLLKPMLYVWELKAHNRSGGMKWIYVIFQIQN